MIKFFPIFVRYILQKNKSKYGKKYTFIDLFAGAGGLSEGFIRAGFEPIAHIEKKKEVCGTLRARADFH